MLSVQTANASLPTSSVRIKTLNNAKSDEQKDLEEESQQIQLQEEQANNEQPDDSSFAQEEEVAFSGRSQRADDIKLFLDDKSTVTAISLLADGSSKEISYETSSTSTRKLLSGRPSIVGEIEDLNLIVVQSLRQSPTATLNKHTLPVPLCHNKSDGDYLLFRVNAQGKVVDVSLKEYEQYVEEHKALTASALKQYSADSVRIKSNSPFASTSGHSMESARGALETKFYVESESVDDSKKDESEIQDVVKQELQKLVDEAVEAFTASPMEDPDYKPEDDADSEDEDIESVSAEESNEQQLDERSWRAQLQDALEHVQGIGKLDGELFAEQIYATYYELNGSDPVLQDLKGLYSRIRADFADEAEEELDDGSESDATSESVTEEELDESTEDTQDSEGGDEWEEALDVVRDLGREDGHALAEVVMDVLYEYNGQQPSLLELSYTWTQIQKDLAAEANEETELDADSESELSVDTESESEDDEESDGDEEYDEALEHIRDIGALDGEAMAGNLLQIMAEENGAEPSLKEFTELWQSIQDQFVAEAQEEIDNEIEDLIESEDEYDDRSDSESDSEYDALSVYELAAATVGADWISRATNLYLDQQGREPTESELQDTVREFASDLADDMLDESSEDESTSELDVSSEETETIESQYGSETESEDDESSDEPHSEYDPNNAADQILAGWDLEDDLEHENLHFDESMLNTPMVRSRKGNGLTWNVYFDENDLSRQSESSNLKRAMQGFKVRNHREANISECKRMAEFLAVPNQLVNEEEIHIRAPVDIATKRTEGTVFVSELTDKPASRGYNIYWNRNQQGNVDAAIRLFQKSNNREPGAIEVSKIKAFMKVRSGLSEQSFVVSEEQTFLFDDDTMEIKVRPKAVVTKKAATGYTLNFDDDEKREQGDEEQAIKWFKRFNKREPSAEESQQIKQFMKADEEEMIDIE